MTIILEFITHLNMFYIHIYNCAFINFYF